MDRTTILAPIGLDAAREIARRCTRVHDAPRDQALLLAAAWRLLVAREGTADRRLLREVQEWSVRLLRGEIVEIDRAERIAREAAAGIPTAVAP